MKTTAAILVESSKPLVLESIEIPPLAFGQVLVKVLCSSICGAQINEINATKGPDKYLPHLMGHEATADVLEVGEGVTTVAAGDRVVMHWRPGTGLQGPTPKYESPIGTVNAGWITTFNEHAIVSENRVTPVPKDFDPEAGALMGCAVTTAFGVLNNDAGICIGESLVIFGVGGVGLSVLQGALLTGAHPIIAVDVVDEKLKFAAQLGATHTINSKTTDAEAAIRDIVGDSGVDVVVESTGNPRVIELGYRVTSASGRTVLVGVPRKGEDVSLYTLPLHFDKVLTGSHGGESYPAKDIPRYVRLCQSGKLDLAPIITNRYAFADINDAIDAMQSGTAIGRCMIAIDM